MKKRLLLVLTFIIFISSCTFIEEPPLSPNNQRDLFYCGSIFNANIILTNDLLDCPGHGLTLNASNIILDCQGHTISGDGSGFDFGINVYEVSNVTIKNCNIHDFHYNVDLLDSDDSILFNNTLYNSYGGPGIWLSKSDNANVTNNTVFNSQNGFYLLNSNNLVVEDNDIQNSDLGGLYLYLVDNSVISNNIVFSNDGGIELRNSTGNSLESNFVCNNTFYDFKCNTPSNIFDDNTCYDVEGCDMVCNDCGFAPPGIQCGETLAEDTILDKDLVDCPMGGLDLDAEGITLDCQGHTISGMGNSAGVYVDDDQSVTIKNCDIHSFDYNIKLEEADFSILLNNTLYNSTGDAGVFVDESHQVQLLDNHVFDNANKGISLYYSHYLLVGGNTVENSQREGIYLFRSNRSDILNNTLFNNRGSASIMLRESGEVDLIDNNVLDNVNSGITLLRSRDLLVEGNIIDGNGVFGLNLYLIDNSLIGNNIISNNEDGGVKISNTTYNNFSDNFVCNNVPFDFKCDDVNDVFTNDGCGTQDSCPGLVCESCSSWSNNPPFISWNVPPTPEDGGVIEGSSVYLSAEVEDSSKTAAFFDWNHDVVGYWSMENYDSVGIEDDSSYDNFASYMNDLSIDNIGDGEFGSGIYFDGVDDYLDAGGDDSLNIGTDDLSVSMWVKLDGEQPEDNSGLVSKGAWHHDAVGYALLYNKNYDRLRFYVEGEGDRRFGQASTIYLGLSDGKWHHVAVSFDRDGETQFFIDYLPAGQGTEIQSNIPSDEDIGNPDNKNLLIGSWMPTDWRLKGSLDQVVIFKRALSLEEVKALYDNQVNDLEHNFTNLLGGGGYFYSASAIDRFGNKRTSSERYVIISEVGGDYCEDGTFISQCSISQPYYCDMSLELVPLCSYCKCPEGRECQEDEMCRKVIHKKILIAIERPLRSPEQNIFTIIVSSVKQAFVNLF